MLSNRYGALPNNHVPDLLGPGLKLVFCGTALGRVSAEKRAYYANPQNLFWRTLHEVGLTPERITPTDYVRLLDFDIGMTDLCKSNYGNDAQLPADAFDVEGLREKIRHHRPARLAFTSKTAAAVFLGTRTGQLALGEHTTRFEGTRLFVLPSPSGQARRYWDIDPWRKLALSLQT